MTSWVHKPTWKDERKATDRTVFVDGVRVGRAYQYLGGPSEGKWSWFFVHGGSGMVGSLKEALEALRTEHNLSQK